MPLTMRYAMARACLRTLLLLAVPLCSTGNPAYAEFAGTDNAAVTHQFFAETLHILGGTPTRVPRWTAPINMAIVGPTTEATRSRLNSLIAQLSLYTGLPIRLLAPRYSTATAYLKAITETPPHDLSACSVEPPPVCANFVVIVSTQQDMAGIADRLPLRPVFRDAAAGSGTLYCFFSPGISRGIEIVRSVVFINSMLNEAMQNTCLQEEITQSLGLFNDYSDSVFYSFNNLVIQKTLTVNDKHLLSSLYDQEFPVGTLATSIARQVVDYQAWRSHSRAAPVTR